MNADNDLVHALLDVEQELNQADELKLESTLIAVTAAARGIGIIASKVGDASVTFGHCSEDRHLTVEQDIGGPATRTLLTRYASRIPNEGWGWQMFTDRVGASPAEWLKTTPLEVSTQTLLNIATQGDDI